MIEAIAIETPAPPRRPQLARWLGRVVFWIWVPVLTLVGASLMVGHWLALPSPAHDPRLSEALNALREPGEESSWLAVHVFYADCGCSQRIVEHISESERPEAVEKALLVGENAEVHAQLTAAGVAVSRVAPSASA